MRRIAGSCVISSALTLFLIISVALCKIGVQVEQAVIDPQCISEMGYTFFQIKAYNNRGELEPYTIESLTSVRAMSIPASILLSPAEYLNP